MADNYFSVLRNRPLETWFDQGIELGGGQAFTVGSEGHERNKKHIVSLTPFVVSNGSNVSLAQSCSLLRQSSRRRHLSIRNVHGRWEASVHFPRQVG